MLIEQLTLTNLLSFGPQGQTIRFEPLSVLIGPNGSGKSNLLEAIDLLRCLPGDLTVPIREGGGVHEWLWKGHSADRQASVEAVFAGYKDEGQLRYRISIAEESHRMRIVGERIDGLGGDHRRFANLVNGDLYDGYVVYVGGDQGDRMIPAGPFDEDRMSPAIKDAGTKYPWDHQQSILAQLRDPKQYPVITHLATVLPRIRLYRDWTLGRGTPARRPQPADMPNDVLAHDASNLGLVLNRVRRDPAAKGKLLDALRSLYDGIDDFDVQIEGGTVQVFLQEGAVVVPATRLSDGTLRYLCLLAILCHPAPPPLVCIEEPELGLHPDILRTLATLLEDASQRTQLIVTTHSDILVDAMTSRPSSVYVCEKREGQTTVQQLSQEKLQPWLERYRLGDLWKQGEIGGTRW